jgi:hypothetical protein
MPAASTAAGGAGGNAKASAVSGAVAAAAPAGGADAAAPPDSTRPATTAGTAAHPQGAPASEGASCADTDTAAGAGVGGHDEGMPQAGMLLLLLLPFPLVASVTAPVGAVTAERHAATASQATAPTPRGCPLREASSHAWAAIKGGRAKRRCSSSSCSLGPAMRQSSSSPPSVSSPGTSTPALL